MSIDFAARSPRADRMLHSQTTVDQPADVLGEADVDAAPLWSGATERALSEQQLRQILSAAEGSTLEFKRVSGKMVGKALETMCAFANCHGGTLILGVADLAAAQGAGRLYGIEENAEAVDELRRKAVTSFDPPLPAVRWLRSPVVGREDKRVP